MNEDKEILEFKRPLIREWILQTRVEIDLLEDSMLTRLSTLRDRCDALETRLTSNLEEIREILVASELPEIQKVLEKLDLLISNEEEDE